MSAVLDAQPEADEAPAPRPVDFLVAAARTNFAAFVSAVHRPRFKHSAFSAKVCRAVDQFVLDVIAGKRPILMLTAPPQHGKLFSMDTPVLTANRGWTTHGTLVAGDVLYRPDGTTTRVVAESAPQAADMRVTFSDGSVLNTHARHEWLMHRTWLNGRTARVVETRAMLARGLWRGEPGKRGARANFQLPEVQALRGTEALLPIKPYTLGVWLGDGVRTRAMVTVAEPDEAIIQGIVQDGYTETNRHVHKHTGVQRAEFKALREPLGNLGLLNPGYRTQGGWLPKFIPDVYFGASYAQRMELLAGLIDSDGYVYPKNGRVTISNTEPELVLSIERLVATFGWRVTTSWFEPRTTSSGVIGRERVAQVCFQPDCSVPCRLARYRDAFKPSAVRRKRTVVNIERGDFGLGKCIQVEHEDGMYLVGDTLVPTHNSSLISRCLPPYLFGRLTGELPAVRIACASYADTLAQRNRRDAQAIMHEPIYREIFPAVSMIGFKGIDNAKDGLQVPEGGALKALGVKGSLTGFSVDCFAAGTLVDTDMGPVRVENLHLYAKTVKVLSYATGQLEYASVKAVGHRQATRIYRITTDAGRVLEVTGNHPIFVGNRYVAAAELAPGDLLVCAVPGCHDADRRRLHEANCALPEWGAVLRQGLHGPCEAHGLPGLSGLRRSADLVRRSALRTVSRGLLAQALAGIRRTTAHALRNLWQGLRERLEGWRKQVLQPRLQEHFARSEDARCAKPAIPGRVGEACAQVEALQPLSVSLCKAGDVGPRRPQVRDMRSDAFAGDAPHRREPAAQFVLQFADTVRELSSAVPQPAHGRSYESDAVRMVEVVDGATTVYDLQVEKNANLFANGVLAHNCGIIDDLIKDAEEALSEVIQERNVSFYDSVFTTRLQERSGQVLIGTPWSSNDILAHVRKKYGDDPRFTLLSFPALNYPEEIGFDPELPRGALVPHLHSETKLREMKTYMALLWWSAMFQQRPLADVGAIFKRQYLQHYKRADLAGVKFIQKIMSVDATFKDGKKSDYVAVGVWGKTADNRVYLLAMRREQLGFVKTAQAIVDLRTAYPDVHRIYVEEAANGAAIIDMLKKHYPQIVGVPPLGSKEARWHAVSWAWDAGMVYLPDPSEVPGIVPWVDEITSVPDAPNDDTADCMAIALQQLLLRTPIAAMITSEILHKSKS